MTPTVDVVARNVRAFSGYAGLTPIMLSKVLNTHKSNVNHKFKGVRKWSFDDLNCLALLFDLEPYEFLLAKPDISKINIEKIKEKLPQLDSNQQPFD